MMDAPGSYVLEKPEARPGALLSGKTAAKGFAPLGSCAGTRVATTQGWAPSAKVDTPGP